MSPETQTDEQVLALVKEKVSTILSTKVDPEVSFESSWKYMRLRKADLYYRGLQYISPNFNPVTGSLDWSAAGTPSAGSGDAEGAGLYDYNIDIVQSYGKKYFATLGLRPFYNAKAVPDDPQSEADRKAARQADLCAEWLRSKWKIKLKNIEMFYLQYVGGTVFLFNPYIADKQLFGEIEEPQFVTNQVPDPSNPADMIDVPDVGTPKKYPASGPACFLLSGDTVTVPFYSRDFSKLPYLLYEHEESQGILLQMYGKILRDKMKDGGELDGADTGVTHTQGKLTRESESSLVGMYRTGTDNTWTHARYWLATSMYEFVEDDDIRAVLYEKFPDGLKVCKVEGVICKLENEDLTDYWGAVLPDPSKTIYHDPVCWPILGNQDITNDLYNIKVAKEERGLPSAVADADLLDVDALNDRPYLPKEIISAKPSFGGNIRDAIVPLPTPNADDGSSSELLDRLQAHTESNLGTMPVVYGASDPNNQTAKGHAMELSQGLMQLGVPGEHAAQGYADAYHRSCKSIAKFAPKGFIIPVPDDQNNVTSEMLDLDALRNGHYHFEPASGMPMSYAEKVNQANSLITENPNLAEAMGFHAPLSAAALRDFLLPDMPEIRSPIEDTRDKVIERIQLLIQQQPIPGMPGPPDPMTGQPGPPGPMQPSIPPEDYVDDPAQHAEIVREWLNSPPGRKAGNDPARTAGYQNVVAYGLLCVQKAVPPQPPPPPPAPPKVSVSLKGADLGPLGITQAVAGDFGAIAPGPGGPGGPMTTHDPNQPSGGQGGPGGPPPPAGPQGPPPPGPPTTPEPQTLMQ